MRGVRSWYMRQLRLTPGVHWPRARHSVYECSLVRARALLVRREQRRALERRPNMQLTRFLAVPSQVGFPKQTKEQYTV